MFLVELSTEWRNREIAPTEVMSEKTVARRLENTYNKLDFCRFVSGRLGRQNG